MEISCDECEIELPTGIIRWFDDDGVIRCQSCHSEWATAQGGDYDYLISLREKRGIRMVQFCPEEP